MTPLATGRSNTSTLFERLEPAERQKLDKAIIDRSPPTFTACYEAYKLADRGISFDAFYRYARRLRTHSELQRMAELTLPTAEDAERILPRIISQQLLELMLAEEPSPEVVHRLANAYRMTAGIRLATERFHVQQVRDQEAQEKLSKFRMALIADTAVHHAKSHNEKARIAAELEKIIAVTDSPAKSDPHPLRKVPSSLPPPDYRDSSAGGRASLPSKRELLDRIDLSVEAALESRRSPTARSDNHGRKKSRRAFDTG